MGSGFRRVRAARRAAIFGLGRSGARAVRRPPTTDAMWVELLLLVITSDRAASANPSGDWQGSPLSAGGLNHT